MQRTIDYINTLEYRECLEIQLITTRIDVVINAILADINLTQLIYFNALPSTDVFKKIYTSLLQKMYQNTLLRETQRILNKYDLGANITYMMDILQRVNGWEDAYQYLSYVIYIDKIYRIAPSSIYDIKTTIRNFVKIGNSGVKIDFNKINIKIDNYNHIVSINIQDILKYNFVRLSFHTNIIFINRWFEMMMPLNWTINYEGYYRRYDNNIILISNQAKWIDYINNHITWNELSHQCDVWMDACEISNKNGK